MAIADMTSEEVQEPAAVAEESVDAAETDPLVEADLLVEDVSIDGMCGVY